MCVFRIILHHVTLLVGLQAGDTFTAGPVMGTKMMPVPRLEVDNLLLLCLHTDTIIIKYIIINGRSYALRP